MVVQPSKHEFECLTGNFADDASQLEAGWSTFRSSSGGRQWRSFDINFRERQRRWMPMNRPGKKPDRPSLIHSFPFRRCSHAEHTDGPPRFTLPPMISPMITKPAANFYNRFFFSPPIFHARSIESVDRLAPIRTEFELKINREINSIIHLFARKHISIVFMILILSLKLKSI